MTRFTEYALSRGDSDIRFIKHLNPKYDLYRLKNSAGTDYSVITDGIYEILSTPLEKEHSMIEHFFNESCVLIAR